MTRQLYVTAVIATVLSTFIPAIALTQSAEVGSIRARILAGRSPAEFASFIVLGTRRGAMCDENGIAVVTSIPAGSYTVKVQAPGFTPVQVAVLVRAGETTPMEIQIGSEVDSIPNPGRLLPGHPDSSWVDSLAATPTPKVYRVAPRSATNKATSFLGRYPIAAEITSPSEAWTRSFLDQLRTPATYSHYASPRVKKLCEPYPTFAVRFETRPTATDVLVCLDCAVIWAVSGTRTIPGGNFDPVGPAFLDAARIAFPNDPHLEELKAKESRR